MWFKHAKATWNIVSGRALVCEGLALPDVAVDCSRFGPLPQFALFALHNFLVNGEARIFFQFRLHQSPNHLKVFVARLFVVANFLHDDLVTDAFTLDSLRWSISELFF